MSGAPICSGTMKLARPPKAKGPANRYSIRLPCMVNSSLYCWKLKKELSGLASWVRMQQRHDPGQEEHDERRDHVAHADHLVVGAGHPLEEPRRSLVVLVLVLVGDRAVGEKGHAAAFVVELDVDTVVAARARLCWELNQARNWLGGSATTWKNMSEWYSPHSWVHWAR